MKKCNHCNVEMMPAELLTSDITQARRTREIEIEYVDEIIEKQKLFGGTKEVENKSTTSLKARLCPKCGKVELYIDIE